MGELIELRITERDANDLIQFIERTVEKWQETENVGLCDFPAAERLVDEVRRALYEASRRRQGGGQ